MIKADHLSYSFPQKDLYNQISFTLEDGQHCAFIGISGSGKSTLIDIIRYPDKHLFEGKLEIPSPYRIGYVSQFLEVDNAADVTVFEYIGEECLRLQRLLASLCEEMATATELDALLEQYQETLDAFEAIGGDDFESHILKKLNLANLMTHKDLTLSELSGGEFKLVQVIREMLTTPDLLIMDEPDVFLDFENLNALKHLINYHKGTLLVITHNRYLLNHCFNKILHLENTELQEFDGRYIDYNFALLSEKIEQQELAHADTVEIERNAALIEKLRTAATDHDDASRGKSLKARIKIQERLEARRIKAPFVAIKQPEIHFTLGECLDEETPAITVSNYEVAFEEPLLENVSFTLNAREKVALIGANGTGKTTLLRAIAANNQSTISLNDQLQIGYLSQKQEEVLDESLSVVETFLQLGFHNGTQVEAYMAPYGFSDEQVYQKVSKLSGGEKNILQLAKIAYEPTNFLLLDEPTSHLDTYSQLALEKSLSEYAGGLLMISHDFYSIVNCMDYALIIDEKTVRKVSMRKFRKMIYARHFDKDYLQLEQKKKQLETQIERSLQANDFTRAKVTAESLEALIAQF